MSASPPPALPPARRPEIDWEHVARGTIHPLRIRIMEHAAEDPERKFAAAELADGWGVPLGNVSYHVRSLHVQGLLARAGQRTVRGAMQRYYRAGAHLLYGGSPAG
jgi:hypothetical protein